ncbi:MAG: nucleoside deaminase [Clostridia bacterium]|nr:nucleoside deaminase [Clostridia bacterium]
MSEHDVKWMRLALEEAKIAAKDVEIPVGAVIVKHGELLACAHNLCEGTHSATAHAELLAIEEACHKVGHWRLEECTLYVTLEPCPMCAGAAINARIPRVVFGARDARMGACGSLLNLASYPLEIKPQYEYGVLEEECASLLHNFFKPLRKRKK